MGNLSKLLRLATNFVQKVPLTENHKALLILHIHESHKSYETLESATMSYFHSRRICNQCAIVRLFTAAYLKGATPTNAISVFRATTGTLLVANI